jgi:hypothetical protein
MVHFESKLDPTQLMNTEQTIPIARAKVTALNESIKGLVV